MTHERPLALVTGAGRMIGIAATIVTKLADTGWNVAFGHWPAYDERMPWGQDSAAAEQLTTAITDRGGKALPIVADLTDPTAPAAMFDQATSRLGPVTALVMCHAESVDSTIRDTTVESFDRHFAVNARASWLLIREHANRFTGTFGTGRIIALTSDHTAGNLPYGASKGALDRIVQASARELSDLGITANVINPGAVDTGWMNPELRDLITTRTPLGRLGTPTDCANLVAFLCSPDGGWINGQLLYSNGGIG